MLMARPPRTPHSGWHQLWGGRGVGHPAGGWGGRSLRGQYRHEAIRNTQNSTKNSGGSYLLTETSSPRMPLLEKPFQRYIV
jgi:hypothetical protein